MDRIGLLRVAAGAPPAERRYDRRFVRAVWLILAGLCWGWIAFLTATMLGQAPPQAGFDLALLLEAGRRVAAGLGPYDPAMLTRQLQAPDLFFSYPPWVAQLMSPIAGLPTGAVLLACAIGSVGGLLFVADRLRLRLAPRRQRLDVLLPVLALAPLVFPYAVALIFGNVDAWFPLLFGLLLLAALGAGRAERLAAGVALGAATLAKLHPTSLLLWLAVRGRDTHGLWSVLGVTVATGAAIVGLSLLVGGSGPWTAYFDVVRVASGADIVTRLNVGPGAELAMLLGAGEAGARILALVIALAALVLTVAAAAVRRDPVESLAWATICSLVTLPVTWYHYPLALIPFAIAAWLRADLREARLVAGLLVGAIAVAGVAILAPVTVWLAVALLMVALLRSAPAASEARA